MRRVAWLVVMCGIAMAGGCVAPPSPFAEAPPARVEFARNGGIAGEATTLTVAGDGAYTLVRRNGEPRNGVLAEAERTRLARMVAEVDWRAVKPSYLEGATGRGADAYTYALTLVAAGSGERVSTAATDLTLGDMPAGVAGVIGYLNELVGELGAGR